MKIRNTVTNMASLFLSSLDFMKNELLQGIYKRMFCYGKKLSKIAKQEEFLALFFDQPRTITDAIVQLTETFSTSSKLDAVSVSQETDAFHKSQPKVAW